MSPDPKEKLIEQILTHCREIAKLDQKYLELTKSDAVAEEGDELSSTARAVARVLERRRQVEGEALARAPQIDIPIPASFPSEISSEDRLPPPPPLEEVVAMGEVSIPAVEEAPAVAAAMAAAPAPRPQQPPVFEGAFGPLPKHGPEVRREREPQRHPEAVPEPKKEPLNLEQLLGTAWLLRIGGVLLLIGAAYGAMLVQQRLEPIHRLLMGYGVSAVLMVVGWLVARKSLMAGRTTQVIGLSLAYFMSFASYFIPYTRVFESLTIPVALMISVAGMIVVLSERWRLQLVAGYGFLLGIVAALFSAPVSQSFALVALGVLAIAAGVLLVRNEWVHLTAFSLVGIYISTGVLWTLIGQDGMRAVVLPHLGALVLYHLVFSVAFWRWSRRWVARELAAEEAPRHDAAPRLDEGMLPFSMAFDIINTLALIALSLHLVQWTGVYWGNVHWLLFGLTGLEVGRLAVPASRRGELGSFHVVIAFGLLTGGLIAAFDGMTESTILAFQALALVIAGTRAKMLRFLRPLGAIPAALAVKEFAPALMGTTDLVSALAPAALLLASALPWEYIFVRRPRRFGTGVLLVLERLSGAGRGLIAAGMAFGAITQTIPSHATAMSAIVWVSVALFAGVIVLSAELWLPAALILLVVPTGYAVFGHGTVVLSTSMPIAWLLIVYLFDEIAKKYRTQAHRGIQWLTFIPLGLMMTVSIFNLTDRADDWRWALLTAGSALCYGIFLAVPKIGKFPCIVRQPEEDEGDVERPEMMVRYGRLSASGAVLLLASAVICVLLYDAPHVLWPSMALAGIAAAVWLTVRHTGETVTLVREMFFGLLALSVYTLGMLIHTEAGLGGILYAFIGGLVFFVVAIFKKMPASYLLGIIQVTGISVLGLGNLMSKGEVDGSTVAIGVVLAALLLGGTRFAVYARRQLIPSRAPELSLGGLNFVVAGWTPLATLMLLRVLSLNVLFSGTFITVAWAVLAIGLLAAGFIFLDTAMRYTAIGVFAVSIIRVVFVELAQSDQLTKVVAFCGLGLVMIASGIGYATVSKRLMKREKAE